MASKCRKFVPNMFNKSKCQACFGSKEAHSAEALENNKASRKVSKCGYLFVAPNFDFSNPLDRTRRWQRRFFRLYDDGELTFCVDDHADTVPQGSVDMNKCTDILDAEVMTSHSNSIAVVTPDKTEYFKADSKEEIQWWHDVLIEFPNRLKSIKTRRKPNFISNKENVQPAQDEGSTNKEQTTQGRFEVEKVRPSGGGGKGGDLTPAYATFKGVRSLKHKYDKNYQEGMRKSSSLHDLSTQDRDLAQSLASSRFLSCSGDGLDVLTGGVGAGGRSKAGGGGGGVGGGFSTNPYFTIPRTSWPSRVHPTTPLLTAPAAHPSLFNSSSSISSTSSNNSATRRGSFEERSQLGGGRSGGGALRDRRHNRERSASLKEFPTMLTLPRESGGSLESVDRRTASVGSALAARPEADDLSQSMSADETDSNETDELKMARSSEISASNRAHPSSSASANPEASSPSSKYEDLTYLKKGWLIKQGQSDRESRKHWFVLGGNSLKYYKDAKAEETNSLDGRIDLSTCFEVSEVSTPRNYGFKIKTRNGEYILAAMTSGIRNNWMKAIRLCMDMHSSSSSKRGLATTLTGKALANLTARTTDDFDTRSGASASATSTAVVTGSKGETAFQLVGRREPGRRENRNVRRHHSDVNPGNVSKMFSIKPFTTNLDQPDPPPPPSSSSSSSSATMSNASADGGQRLLPTSGHHAGQEVEKVDSSPRASKIPRHHSPSSESLLHSAPGSSLPLKRYVEGSDSLVVAAPVLQGVESRRSKRNMTGDGGSGSIKEEEKKREMMRRAKSPSARVMEKSRAAKTPRLHSPPPDEEGFEYHRTPGSGQTDSSQLLSDTEDDMDMTISSEEPYLPSGGHDEQDGAHTDSVGDGMMVELLESEVESLKERLDQTQCQLVKMHESNIDLKSRLQKETSQNLDSSYSSGHSGRWNQQPTAHMDSSQSVKRQLKESKDTVQKQRMEIDSLKSKLDMSLSKLTGTEKALAEALKEYKQEKEKFVKYSTEWNRRIRTLEGQLKEGTHKLEHTRDNLLTKERECRRLDHEAKQQQQKTREQEREILKLKAVEHEYNQLKEQLDNKDRELMHAHSEMREKDSRLDKLQSEFAQQMGEMEQEYSRERDDLENHLEELKSQLCSAQERQSTMENNMTSGMADFLTEKDEMIAQLEERVIENDRKICDMQEELQAEMGENSDLVHNMEILQEEKQQLQHHVDSMEKQVVSLKEKVDDLEKDNHTLRQHLDRLRQENAQLTTHLKNTAPASSDPEKRQLEMTVEGLNKQIQGLQLKLMERFEETESSKSTGSEQDDLLHNILIMDSDLKEVNNLLKELQDRFDAYVSSVTGEPRKEASVLSEMINQVGHRCQQLQETLQQGSAGDLLDGCVGEDYHHAVTVTAASSSVVILEEYRGLKGKFDRVVAELKKLKKELNESSCSELERRDKQMETTMGTLEDSYKQQVENLVNRVDQLSAQLASQHSTLALQAHLEHTSTPPSKVITTQEVGQQLSHLDSCIHQMEKTLAEVPLQPTNGKLAGNPSPDASTAPVDSQMMGRLKDMHQQLEHASKDLQDMVKDLPGSVSNPHGLPSQQQALAARLDSCGQKVDKLTQMVQDNGTGSSQPKDNPSSSPGCKGGCPEVMDSSASSMERCMLEVMERIQEIGEQLDALEDGAEDSDDDEEEATTIDDVREHLANLSEYVKQHSKFSDHDWRLMQLLSAQKAVISKDRLDSLGSDPPDSRDKLQAYADRLSLESLILVEMSHLLERDSEEQEEDRDPVMREVGVLNSKVLSLYQKLDEEMRTLCVTGTSADILRVQADILAEKLLVEGQLCSSAFSQDSHLSEEEAKEEVEKKTQPQLLASEAILRSQLDSFIGHNLDKSCDELWSSASHLTTRSLVQGELTFALNSLKKQLDSLPASKPAVSARDFSFQRLQDRHKAVMEVAEAYQEKMIQALAIIISKESEEMTIVEGPENVLEAVCSEVSTIMEKHIQRYKEKVRTASDTLTAHRWDMMVNQLRADREIVLTEIRKQHTAYASDPDSESDIEVPFQTLDSSINNFGEIMSLRSILCAHLDFIVELLKMGDTTLLAEMEVGDEDERGEEEENDDDHRALQRGLSCFVHNLAEALKAEAQSKQCQVNKMLTDQGISPSSIPNIPHPKNASTYCSTLSREAVFAAQTTFMMYKLKLLHQQEMDALKAARPARTRPAGSSEKDGREGEEGDIYQMLAPLEEVLDTKYDDEMETLRVIASQVGKLEGVMRGRDWPLVEEHVRQLEQKVQDELGLAKQRHEVHLDLFKQEESKVEHLWEEGQQEREHFEARCSDLEEELRSVSNLHNDEVERMRQDVMTAVSAIRANEEESETQLADRVQVLTKQMTLQKDNYKRFLDKLKGQLVMANKEDLVDMVKKELTGITDITELPDDEEIPPLPSQPPPDAPQTEENSFNREEEIELLKKEKDEALAEETRNTKAALDAMRKAYEEELQHERQKYRECLTTMYNEDFVNEIRRRHEEELEKTQEELKQVKMHYMSKCEDLKLLEVKLGQTKQDYESHINQLIKSNDHLDDMVNQEIERLKDFIKNRPTNLTTGTATLEEELYDAQIMIRVKDAELQKLRSQVKNFENSLHRTTEEHRQTMTQYLQALKENQELRKEYQTEMISMREQLDKAQHDSGTRRPIRRAPSFHQRARSPSPTVTAPHRRDSTSATTEHVSRDSNRRRRIDPKDLRRSKSSPSLPYIFDPKGIATTMKSPGKGDRRQSQKL
ncbi:uncharacterized protein LOC143292921 isoform X2 [Babylonia areolata]|uniref:uncharacterized protein LOC143292921 isoform X2 n=1 Tax=Babylonia areolata TaxID=304850 RepID=UPI003FD65E3A